MTIPRAIRSLFAAAALTAGAAEPATASSAAPLGEDAAIAAGFAVVEAAAQGRVAEAFRDADALRRAGDDAFAAALAARQQAVANAAAQFGAARGPVRLLPAEPSIFSGCLRREYRVRYAGGEQRWLLKFRRTAGGWTLADLEIVAEPST